MTGPTREERQRLRIVYAVTVICIAPVFAYFLKPWGFGVLLAAMMVVDGILTIAKRDEGA